MKEKEQKKRSVGLVLLLQFIVLLVVFVLNAIMSGGVQEILIGIYHYIDSHHDFDSVVCFTGNVGKRNDERLRESLSDWS